MGLGFDRPAFGGPSFDRLGRGPIDDSGADSGRFPRQS